MTGNDQPGRTVRARGSRGPVGPRVPSLAEDDALEPATRPDGDVPEDSESDDVADAEILDAADVSAAVDEVFADDDPLALALNQRDQLLGALHRLQADFENYKKRIHRQQAEQMERAKGPIVETLLPVLDAAAWRAAPRGGRVGRWPACQAVSTLFEDALARRDSSG